MDIIYSMPNQIHRMFINVIHACPNACLFCVDFKGDTFYGFDLKKGKTPSVEDICTAVAGYRFLSRVEEVYFCGIGEPLLRHDVVVECARKIREVIERPIMMAINTSGTFYGYKRTVEFARDFDLIQVSLNAESEAKYNSLCRPKIEGAYRDLRAFLDHLKEFMESHSLQCRVELSVVDTSEAKYMPHMSNANTDLPIPNIEQCMRIAEGYGWPLKIKKLIRDCELPSWEHFADSLRESG